MQKRQQSTAGSDRREHRALRETIAPGQCVARAAVQVFLPHVGVEPFGPLHMLAEGLTLFPGAVVALCAFKPPQMEPQPHGAYQHGSAAHTPRPAVLHAGATPLIPGTPDERVATLKMKLQLLEVYDLIDDTEFW